VTLGKTLQVFGVALAVIMVGLTRVGTTSSGLYNTWILFIILGVGLLLLGRRIEDTNRKRRFDADFEARRSVGE
jgi:hypothetical protein